jgi:hypothetical protein
MYIIIIIIIIVFSQVFPGTFPLEPVVNPTTHASSFWLQHFPYNVWYSQYSCFL